MCDDLAQVGASAEDLATWLKTAKNAAAKASLECHTGPPPPPRSGSGVHCSGWLEWSVPLPPSCFKRDHRLNPPSSSLLPVPLPRLWDQA